MSTVVENNVKEMSVYAKERFNKDGQYIGVAVSFTNGKAWFDVAFSKECPVAIKEKGYWLLTVDKADLSVQTHKPTNTGFQPNPTIWVNKVISLVKDEKKNKELAQKRLDAVNDLFD